MKAWKIICWIILGIFVGIPMLLIGMLSSALLMTFLIPASFTFVGGVIYWRGLRSQKWERLIKNTPTSTIQSIAMGFVELNGKPTTKTPLKGPLSGKDCVWYRLSLQTQSDKGWKTVRQIEYKIPFTLTDNTGQVDVNPDGIELDVDTKVMKVKEINKEFPKEIIESIGDRYARVFGKTKVRIIEHYLPLTKKLYLMGTATKHPHKSFTKTSMEGVIIQKENSPFYMADRSEMKVRIKLLDAYKAGMFWGTFLILIGLGVIILKLGI